jgi:hypothetical protein
MTGQVIILFVKRARKKLNSAPFKTFNPPFRKLIFNAFIVVLWQLVASLRSNLSSFYETFKRSAPVKWSQQYTATERRCHHKKRQILKKVIYTFLLQMTFPKIS